MKIVGVIVEYNPLHNGHIHHMQEVKRLSGADVILAVLSSTFTMRGDLSLFDKFTKTKHCLWNGIDIIIELPMVLAMHKADIFAKNAVALLQLMGANEIWIGSETNDASLYEKCYEALQDKDSYIAEELKKGKSYKEITGQLYPLSSNDLLGYAYYKAIRDNRLPIKLKTIPRIHSNYLDTAPKDSRIASALAIRSDLRLIRQYTPEFIHSDLPAMLKEEELFPYIKYKILSTPTAELKKIFFVDEGLENSLKEIAGFTSYPEFIKHLTTKRYTSTRIKRMLAYIFCNIQKEEMNTIFSTPVDFVRILGYSSKGREYLSSRKKEITIYTNIREGLTPALDMEIRISKLIDSIFHTHLLQQEQKGPVFKE